MEKQKRAQGTIGSSDGSSTGNGVLGTSTSRKINKVSGRKRSSYRKVGNLKEIGNNASKGTNVKGFVNPGKNKKYKMSVANGASKPNYKAPSNMKQIEAAKRKAVIGRAQKNKRIAQLTDQYLINGTKSNSAEEATAKISRVSSNTQAISYDRYASNIAIINDARNGNVSIEEAFEAVDICREESSKNYEYTSDIGKNLDYNLDEFELNLAKETIKNYDTIEGSAEEVQSYIDRSIEILQNANINDDETKEIITKDLGMPVESLKKGRAPKIVRVSDENYQQSILNNQKTEQDLEDAYQAARLNNAVQRYKYASQTLATSMQLSGMAFGSFAAATTMAGSGGSVKDIASAALVSGPGLGDTMADLSKNAVTLTGETSDRFTHREEKAQQAVKTYADRKKFDDSVDKKRREERNAEKEFERQEEIKKVEFEKEERRKHKEDNSYVEKEYHTRSYRRKINPEDLNTRNRVVLTDGSGRVILDVNDEYDPLGRKKK